MGTMINLRTTANTAHLKIRVFGIIYFVGYLLYCSKNEVVVLYECVRK